MNRSSLKRIFDLIKVPIDDPLFYTRTFLLVAKNRQRIVKMRNDEIHEAVTDEYYRISRGIEHTKVQDASTVRLLLRVRMLVMHLINEKGELVAPALSHIIHEVREHLYSLGPERQYDAKHQEQLLRALIELERNKEIQIQLRKVSAPYMNRQAEQVIRDTLLLPPNSRINDPQAKCAVLAAWLCTLRQNVGSCFATAPAILVHDQQPILMFKDIIELLGTGRLKRTYAGTEHSVPFSASWGGGDLRRPNLVPTGPFAETAGFWLSPAFCTALEAAGLISKELPIKEKIEKSKDLFLPILTQWNGEAPQSLLTPEDLLKRTLLFALKINPEDLKAPATAVSPAFTGSVMMQTAASSGGKGQGILQFQTKFDAACEAFKAFGDNALLKTWEFTLASFAETKATFARWNLYSSLGLGAQEEGGIGHVIYNILQTKLERVNREIEEVKIEYEQSTSLISYLQARMRAASSEKEMEWIKLEYRTRQYEYGVIEERLENCQHKAQGYSNMLNLLVNIYSEIFPRYFQEVYDADMRGVVVGPFDDSPAGFRLLYKHGRSNTAQWSRIETPEEFIDALASFFTSTENEVSSHPHLEGFTHDITDIVTAIVVQIRSAEFLETAFHRMARAHGAAPIKNPLEHLDKIEKKPWAYTSGGTMNTLVSTYWRREQSPTEVSRWIESPTELLVFLVDTLKQMPASETMEFEKDPKRVLLMHSPTHAFLLKPGLTLFKRLWQSELFTYTHIRDEFIKPSEQFISDISLDQSMAQYLIDKIAQKVPLDFRHYFKQVFNYVPVGISPTELRYHLDKVMYKERGLGYGKILPSAEIDSLLFSLLPLFPGNELKGRLDKILKKLPNIGPSFLSKFETLWEELPITMLPGSIIDAQMLQNIVKSILCILYNTTSTPDDYHFHVSHVCKSLGFAMPMPIIIADSNWVRDEFGFLVNPGTGRFEFWRVDYTGSVGHPLVEWAQWLDGSQRDSTWNVYSHPREYTS